jgi:hypothetical protein
MNGAGRIEQPLDVSHVCTHWDFEVAGAPHPPRRLAAKSVHEIKFHASAVKKYLLQVGLILHNSPFSKFQVNAGVKVISGFVSARPIFFAKRYLSTLQKGDAVVFTQESPAKVDPIRVGKVILTAMKMRKKRQSIYQSAVIDIQTRCITRKRPSRPCDASKCASC